MGVNFSKSSHIVFFAIILPALSWIITIIFFQLFPNWPNWMESPSPLFAYGLLYYLFDRCAWKLGIFRKVGVVWFPNLSGRWIGIQRSSFIKNGKNVKVNGVLEIRQSFSSVSINAYYSKSESLSVTASFSKLNGEVYLYYSFDNDPNTFKQGTMQKHRGTAKIKKLPKSDEIIGFYWNSIGNSGDMKYRFDQSKLLGRL